MMSRLALLLLLIPTSLSAQFGVQPGFLDVDRHWKTQVGHGVVTVVGAGLGAAIGELVADEATTGARVGALVMTAFYVLREREARASYRDELERGVIDQREHSKLLWDSAMDQAYPGAVAVLTFRLDHWEWWLAVPLLLYWGNGLDPCPTCYAHGMR